MTRAYFKGAVGALVVFDLGDSQTYSAARKWKADIDKKCALPDGRKIPSILIANKVRSTKIEDLQMKIDFIYMQVALKYRVTASLRPGRG